MLVLLLLCTATAYAQPARPLVDVPYEWRESNWLDKPGRLQFPEGSCAHAALITCLRMSHAPQLANYWRARYGAGETGAGLAALCEREGIPYDYCPSPDPGFLERAMRHGLPAVIQVPGQDSWHAVTVCHFDSSWACILDNNDTARYRWLTRAEFLTYWQGFGLVVAAPAYPPAVTTR